jgi:hypothetical protein
MKDGVKYLVGKQIAAVVVARSKRPPNHQVFLIFPDGTRFEFWGENFSCCSSLDRAEMIEEYVKDGGGEIVQVHAVPLSATVPAKAPLTTGRRALPYHLPAPESMADAMKRDLEAWKLTRAAITRARGSLNSHPPGEPMRPYRHPE